MTCFFRKSVSKVITQGICNETNHGNLIMVKDRENNDKLLVCAEEKSVYLWKTTDGKICYFIITTS